MQQHSQSAIFAAIGVILTTLFWAGNAVVARSTVGDIPPVALAFWRWAVALAILLPFGIQHVYRARAALRQHWLALLCLSLLSVATFNTLLYIAAQSTTAINITLVNSAMPVSVAIMAWLLLRQPTSAGQAVGIGAAAIGTLIIVSRGDLGVLANLNIHPGDAIMVAAILVWGVYSVLLRRWSIPIHPVGFLTATIAVGTLMLLPVYLLEYALLDGYTLNVAHAPVFLYLAIFPGILAYLFWNHGIAVLGPSRSAMFIYLMPVFAAVLATLFIGERLYAYHAAGGAFILAGLFLATQARQSPAQ
ncbi:DMT family transporter [Alkalilimnicola ehrlichii]|uniref:DMT family transporter n=1 Tax=Alkalilimnicola ehrlichii TaxID=351052 RepID=UPI000E2EA911|nr:DMT family transporter [Alkalilimnicola ehrlichii]